MGISAAAETIANASTYDSPSATNNTSTSTSGNICVIEGVIKPSADGTVTIRFASEISGSAITALAGSTLTWW